MATASVTVRGEAKESKWRTEGRVVVSVKEHSLCWMKNTTCNVLFNAVKIHVKVEKKNPRRETAMLKEICPNLVIHRVAADVIHMALDLGENRPKSPSWDPHCCKKKRTEMHFKMSHQSLDESAEKMQHISSHFWGTNYMTVIHCS